MMRRRVSDQQSLIEAEEETFKDNGLCSLAKIKEETGRLSEG